MGCVGVAVAEIELDYLNWQKDRNGKKKYAYFRRNGRRWPLPGAPGSEEFMAEYRRLEAATAPGPTTSALAIDRRDYPRGSFGALINDFLATASFKTKKPRTQAEYRRVCEALSAAPRPQAGAVDRTRTSAR